MKNWPAKYRPNTFRSLKGQPEKALLWNILLSGERIPSALLFTGPPGVGKTTLARITAASVNCPNFTEKKDNCGECISCKEILSGGSSLVLEYDAASNSGAEDMRRVRELTLISSPRGRYVFIIDECHSLSHQAWNVLLKILEEPKAPCTFIFVTSEPSKVPVKIRTRTIRFDLRRVPPKEITEVLKRVAEREGVLSADLDHIVDLSDGSVREAIKLLEQFHLAGKLPEQNSRKNAVKYTASVIKGDKLKSLEALDEWWSVAGEFSSILEELAWVLEKVLFIQNNIPIQVSDSTLRKLSILSNHLDADSLGIFLELVSHLSFSVGRRGTKANLIFLTSEAIRRLHGNVSVVPKPLQLTEPEEDFISPMDLLEGANFND